MKKTLLSILFGVLISLTIISPVKAEEVYYTNQYGVDFTKKQYDYYTEMFFDGYQEKVTQADFNQVLSLDLFDAKVEKEYFTFIPTKMYGIKSSPTNYENGRTLGIGKSCTTQCFYSLSVVWGGIPTVTSYDVFGARIAGGTITSINTLYVFGTGYSDNQNNPDVKSNGFGFSVSIPPVSSLTLSVSFYATTGAVVFGSYQHAMSYTTLAISKMYDINYTGFGDVFDFYGAAYSVYDNCNGVNI